MAINASAELSVLQAVAQFLTYAVMAVFAENAVFFRALGVSRLNKLVNDPKISTWQYWYRPSAPPWVGLPKA